MELENNIEQPYTDSHATDNQPEADGNKGVDKTAKVTLGDGSEVTIDELKQGYMRQSDYTKKTQELASQKKGPELSDEEKQMVEKFKAAGIASVDEIQKMKAELADKEDLTNFISATQLSETQLKMVKDLKKLNKDKSYADIANEYGLIDEATVNRAKGGVAIKGSSFALPKQEEPFKVDVTKAGYHDPKTFNNKLKGMKF